jgi:hypothetical protein
MSDDLAQARNPERRTDLRWASDGAAPSAPETVDARYIVSRLSDAGRTLLALPAGPHNIHLLHASMEVMRMAVDAADADADRLRPRPPSAGSIDLMDDALSWISLIPRDRYVLRRIIGSRCLVSPVTGRHLYSWRRLGTLLGADHKAIKRWHDQGIDMIVRALNRRGTRNG